MPSRRTWQALAGAALLVGAFAVGFLTAHLEVFPFPLVAGLVAAQAGGEVAVAARAPDAPGQAGSDRRPGLWHLVRDAAAAGLEPDPDLVGELADLPYLSGYATAPPESGVTVLTAAAHDGLNLVVSGHAPEALLMDMRGRVVHRWGRELADVWPLRAGSEELGGFETFWRRAHLLPGGDLLAIWDGIGLVKLDRDSNVVWAHAGRQHHDLFVAGDGTIYTLTRRTRREHARLDVDAPIEEDFVTVLDAAGAVQWELSLLDSLLDSDHAALLGTARRRGDILHTNTIEVMDGRFAGLHPLYERGNLLVSFPRLDTVAVVDPDRARVVWALGGPWRFQHQPTVLDDGRLLVFDNTGDRGDSKVVEIEPLTQRIVWSYRGSPARRFTSYFLGSSQRLGNGNTLITESTAGRAFEVDAGGRTVWEFVNPHRAGQAGGLIASLLEVVRIDPAELEREFLSGLSGEGAAGAREARP